MKKVYVLINTDINEIIAASKTKTALKEELCDRFMTDFQYDCQVAVDEYWINPENLSNEDRILLKENWDSLVNYYKEYLKIEKVDMI